jgi:hypothetical protein
MTPRAGTRVLTLAALVAVTTGAGAQTPVVTGRGQGRGAAPAFQPAAAKGTGLILGQVLDASSGRPVLHALVTLAAPPAPPVASDPTGRITSLPPGWTAAPQPPGVRIVSSPVVSIGPIEVDDAGRFVFFDLPRGDYVPSARAAGYVAGASEEGGTRRIIHLSDGQRVGDAAIRLSKTVTIGGRLLDEFGDPMVGVDVQLSPHRSAAQMQSPIPSGATLAMGSGARTDDRGIYKIAGQPAGDYIVMVTASYITTGGMPADQLLAALAVLGGAPPGSSMGLGSGLSVSGSFYIGGAEVQPWGTLAHQTPPTRPGGRMEVYPTTFSPDALSPAQAQVISLRPGEERLDVDVHLRLVPTVRVSGRLVLPPDAPTLHELVRLIPAGGTSLTTLAGAAGPQGQFVIVGVAPGQYTIIAERDWPPNSPHLLAQQSITVGSTDLKGIQLLLVPQKQP